MGPRTVGLSNAPLDGPTIPSPGPHATAFLVWAILSLLHLTSMQERLPIYEPALDRNTIHLGRRREADRGHRPNRAVARDRLRGRDLLPDEERGHAETPSGGPAAPGGHTIR